MKIAEIKQRWLLMFALVFLSFATLSATGCAGRTKTSTVTTQTSDGSGSSNTVTTQNETVTDARPRGVIGGIFYTIGQVLIFPFRVIGNLFS